MADPTLDPLEESLDPVLKRVIWKNTDASFAEFTESRFDFQLTEDDEFELLPNGEYKYYDDEGYSVAWMDDFFNLHWLLKRFDGHVFHHVTYVKPILEDMAKRKYLEKQ